MSKHITTLLTSILVIALYAVPAAASGPDKQDMHSEKAHSHDAQPSSDEAQPHEDAGAHEHGNESYSVGVPAEAAVADRTVDVVMSDAMTYTFTPNITSIRDGEVINFVVSNEGKIDHEFSIGNQEDQKEHAAMMVRMPGMVHDDPNTVTVTPGESRTLTWRFKGDDMVVFACNIPGHYQAGMFKNAAITKAEEHGHSEQSSGHGH